jgi:hypothetical protein
MIQVNEEFKEKKKWAKLNIEPNLLKIIKKVAIDENLKIYQLIDKMFRENYPSYFKK